jgi:hypothetical protein
MPRIVKGENSDVSDLNPFPFFGIRPIPDNPFIPASGRAVFQSETIYVLRDAGKARNRAFPVQFVIGPIRAGCLAPSRPMIASRRLRETEMTAFDHRLRAKHNVNLGRAPHLHPAGLQRASSMPPVLAGNSAPFGRPGFFAWLRRYQPYQFLRWRGSSGSDTRKAKPKKNSRVFRERIP